MLSGRVVCGFRNRDGVLVEIVVGIRRAEERIAEKDEVTGAVDLTGSGNVDQAYHCLRWILELQKLPKLLWCS